jgi:hypothetical protein
MKYYTYEFSNNYLLKNINFKLLSLYFEEKVWIHANPAMYSNNNKLIAKYYEKNDDSDRAIKKLSQLLCSDVRCGIVLHANKGAGKTFISNYFLNTQTKTLNTQCITWVRIDITKIYQNYFLAKTNITLQEYLYAQIVFVYFRYKDILQKYDCKIANYDSVLASVDEEKIINDLNIEQNSFDKIKKQILEAKCFSDGIEGKPIHNEYTERIALSILKFLKAQDNHIVLFVDGVDNIDYQIDFFDTLKNELNDFFISHEKMFKNIVLVSRTENYQEIVKTDTNGYWNNSINIQYGGEDTSIELKPIDFKEFIGKLKKRFLDNKIKSLTQNEHDKYIIKLVRIWINFDETKKEIDANTIKKVEYLLDNSQIKEIKDFIKTNDLFFKNIQLKNKLKEEFGTNILEVFEKLLKYDLGLLIEYFEFASSLEGYVKKAFIDKSVIKKDERFNLLEDLFNNDLRELINLSIDSFIYIYTYINRTNLNHQKQTMKNYLNYGKNYRIVMEALFKNGNLYTPCKRDKLFIAPYRNLNFINILNPLFKNSIEYSPLVYLCFLDYINNQKNVSKTDLFNSFKAFIPENEKIEDIFQCFLEYNYIEIANKNTVKLTKKGLFIFQYSFRDINVLLSYVFGGLWDEAYQKYLKRYGQKWENYLSVLLQNITVLLVYLDNLKNSMYRKTKYMLDIDFFNEHIKNDFLYSITLLQEFKLLDTIQFDNSELGLKLQENFKYLTNEIIGVKQQISRYEYKSFAKEFSFLEKEQEKVILLVWFLNIKISDIVENYYLHHFVFGDFKEDKLEIRQQQIIECKQDYNDGRALLEKLKIHFIFHKN